MTLNRSALGIWIQAAGRLLRSLSRLPETWKVFCLMPWLGLHVSKSGEVFPCCIFRKEHPVGSLRESTLRELWNSPGMRDIRGNMLTGRPSRGCDSCYKRESYGFLTTRLWSLAHFFGHLPRAASTPDDGFARSLRMPYMDIRFSNLCDLRCRMCDSVGSSGWYQDSRRLSVRTPTGLLRPMKDPEDLWRQIEPLLPSLEEVSFSGGEPLLMDEHYRLLDRLLELRLSHVRLRYTTSFSTMHHGGRDVMRLWDRFDKVAVVASLDASGRRGEYLRKGLEWERVVCNRRRMFETCPRVDFRISATLTAMNALHLPDFHREWVESGFIALRGMKINPLFSPEEYQARLLPSRLKLQAIEKYRWHIEDFIRSCDPLDWLHPGSAERRFKAVASFLGTASDPHGLAAFKVKTLELDRLRGESFTDVFPELAEMMGEP